MPKSRSDNNRCRNRNIEELTGHIYVPHTVKQSEGKLEVCDQDVLGEKEKERTSSPSGTSLDDKELVPWLRRRRETEGKL